MRKPRVSTLSLCFTYRSGHSRSFCCDGLAAEAEAKAKAGEKEDYKGDSKFATHLKTGQGVSAFAKSRTLKEQREYLPAFACREELLKVIRDNQGVYSAQVGPCHWLIIGRSYRCCRRDWVRQDDPVGTIHV